MLPLVYSVREAQLEQRGWRRCGADVQTEGEDENTTQSSGDSSSNKSSPRYRYVDGDCEQICYYKVKFLILTFPVNLC